MGATSIIIITIGMAMPMVFGVQGSSGLIRKRSIAANIPNIDSLNPREILINANLTEQSVKTLEEAQVKEMLYALIDVDHIDTLKWQHIFHNFAEITQRLCGIKKTECKKELNDFISYFAQHIRANFGGPIPAEQLKATFQRMYMCCLYFVGKVKDFKLTDDVFKEVFELDKSLYPDETESAHGLTGIIGSDKRFNIYIEQILIRLNQIAESGQTGVFLESWQTYLAQVGAYVSKERKFQCSDGNKKLMGNIIQHLVKQDPANNVYAAVTNEKYYTFCEPKLFKKIEIAIKSKL